MTALDAIVEALMSPMISVWRLMSYRFCIAAQLVGDDDSWLAKLSDQPVQKTLGSFGIPACLDQDVESVTVGIDCAPEPVLCAADRDHNFIQVPLIVRPRPVASDAGGKMSTETIDPEANGLAADDDAAFRQQVLNIRRAQREPVVGPDRISDDFTRITEALQARH